MARAEMKYSHECWHLWAFVSIAMYPAIRSSDEQAFDNMSEESGKKKEKKLSLRNRCSLFQIKAWLNKPKKTWWLQSPAR